MENVKNLGVILQNYGLILTTIFKLIF